MEDNVDMDNITWAFPFTAHNDDSSSLTWIWYFMILNFNAALFLSVLPVDGHISVNTTQEESVG